MKYLEEVQRGMDLLAEYGAIFVGQAVEYKGTGLTHQLKNYPKERLLELPVAEEFQMGFCLGMAIDGFFPVSIYPRANFAILAANQIVNHLDKWVAMGGRDIQTVIKVAVGSEYPLDPGHQHKANYAQAFESMCDYVDVVDLIYPHEVYPAYHKAAFSKNPTIIFEHSDLYKC